jgi:hypothetical protein
MPTVKSYFNYQFQSDGWITNRKFISTHHNLLFPFLYEMNASASYTAAGAIATANDSIANHNTVPMDIDISNISPVTQSQQTYDTNTPSTINNNHTFVSPSSSTSNRNGSSQTIPNVPHVRNFTRVYHERDINYIMDDYCLPIADSFKCATDTCKFGRECLVAKQSVLLKGHLLQTTSSTLFTSVPPTSKKTNTHYMISDY